MRVPGALVFAGPSAGDPVGRRGCGGLFEGWVGDEVGVGGGEWCEQEQGEESGEAWGGGMQGRRVDGGGHGFGLGVRGC
ncbi:MAG: hypothetical protein RI897_3574 [Verrucomicrobiota bacterium]